MNDDILLEDLRSKIALSEEEYSAYRKLFFPRRYSKKEHVFKAGDIVEHIVFIVKGCMRIYYAKSERTRHTVYFAEERWWTGDIAAMRSGTPTYQNLEALEDCEVLIMSKENWEYAYNTFQWFADFHNTGHQRWMAKLNKQIGQLLLDPPETNYERMLTERPALLQRLPDYYVAGYLGITPEQLMMIKNEYIKA